DWLRTDIRGANAVRLRLSSEVELTLGPGALIECVSPVLARVHTGEVQLNLPKADHPQFELLAPREGSRKFSAPGKSIVRVDRASEKLADVKDPPKWLLGFEGASADESLGSLIVNIDGRNEPLAVGYHKVNVEIRDQIARTTIEESFVNSTSARLEGVFHFPLPQDASISDFGMWIGNNLVEADVVEKQRAREIYETILRERRDPGLLEWTGGNIFKARVFPIEANSEKRIKIVYTQVLPLRANRYRYSYALRSELLRKKPLRELSLTVTVNSALPLKSVRCPTHDARVNETAHSAQVAFAAQEYTPTRDFEVVCEIDGRQSDVVVIPHRRGDDGYVMVQLTPPATEGNWQRELVADGKPLDLILLCDTSASMDSEKRKQQAEFVATVLSSLGEKDHFWLAAADVSTVWASKEPLASTAQNIAKARDFLDHRLSLGWTNLEQAFEAVGKKAPAGAQIVYIGDGIVTAGRADPVDFVNRLGRMFSGEAEHRVFHAVTVGNSFESTVLK
ncbi:MAG TPA: VIT and VWA domain-containing protein, partial [Pirellulales bacterium]|nr:VIT and VWA domain-containing protein [Pirellulales bacterium]